MTLPLGNPESAAGFVLILQAFKPNTTALYMGEKRVRVNKEKEDGSVGEEGRHQTKFLPC